MNINQNKTINIKFKLISVLPILALAAVTPLIVHLEIIPIDQTILDFWNHDKQNSDYFSYYKSIFIISASVLSLAVLLIGIATKRIGIKRTYLYIPMILFVICIFLSTILSDYRHTAIYGFPDRYEGAFILLAYLAVLFTTINLVNEEIHIKMILGGILASSVIIGIIGVLQVFGLDLFDTALGKSIILTPQFRDFAGSIKSLSAVSSAISTLYNSNSLGLYMSMLFPLTLSLFLLTDNKTYRIITGAIVCLIFSNLIGSNSRGSYISMIVSSIIIAFIIRKRLITHWKQMVCIFSSFIFIYIGLNYLSSGYTNSRMASALSVKDMHTEDSTIDKIKNFDINGNQLTLYCTNSQLKLAVDNNQLKFFDEKDKELIASFSKQNDEITLEDKKYDRYSFMSSKNLIKVQKGKSFLYFAVINNSFYLMNSKGTVINDFSVEKLGFKGMERLASGRGYIWSRTLPLLSHTIFWGHGPDTFAMYFPQNDYKGKLNFMYDANMIIDKPHNMYLQTAVNTGVLSLIAFLCILAYYILSSINLFRKNTLENIYSKTGFAIFASIIGYLISGLFTDSTVSVAPLFWVLLGIGISINFNSHKRIKIHI